MAFPKGFMDELHSRLSLAEQVGKKVKLTRKGVGQYWGLCPFHSEKTASFSVADDKGFYHCFGCGAHGDIISFVMATEGLSFPEAIERLAAAAGLEVPQSSPAERQREQHRATLYDTLEKACHFYAGELTSPNGAPALKYLYSRGLTPAAIDGFHLGWSGGGKSLKSYLLKEGVTEEQLVSSGLFKKGEGGLYEYFRNRVMFPITDKRGRTIAFGGRVLDDSEPKYLNSPETDIFHKGKVLYAFSKAAVPAFNRQMIVLVEGYMDVIALHMAGCDFAVAPLGTALTEAQIEALWKVVPEPIICFDGDKAGQTAAARAADRVLPILKEGKSLRFTFLTEGKDPDEIIKKRGKQAFQQALASALPLSDFLWRKLTRGKSLTTPERKAALEKDIAETLGRITNAAVKNYYTRDFKDRLWKLTSEHARTLRQKNSLAASPRAPSSSYLAPRTAPAKLLKTKAGLSEGKMILAYLVCYPDAMAKWLEKITMLDLFPAELAALSDFLLSQIGEKDSLTKEDIFAALEERGAKDTLHIIASEIEMLGKTQRFKSDIDKEMTDRLTALELKNLDLEIEEAGAELNTVLDNPPEDLLARYNALLSERNRLKTELCD